VLTEQIFAIPGFGKMLVDGVFNRDLRRRAGRRARLGRALRPDETSWPTSSTSSRTHACEAHERGVRSQKVSP
jgi:hypothetical protein